MHHLAGSHRFRRESHRVLDTTSLKGLKHAVDDQLLLVALLPSPSGGVRRCVVAGHGAGERVHTQMILFSQDQSLRGRPEPGAVLRGMHQDHEGVRPLPACLREERGELLLGQWHRPGTGKNDLFQ